MCGICGVITQDAARLETAVRRMMNAMVHRGPDDEGYIQLPFGDLGGAACGFGFRRLAILDLSPGGHQPMINELTGDCLVFNGEIYNYKDIREKLQRRGICVQSSGDAEVLLKALSTWGENVLDDIDGMYAFAFFHSATRRVLLARDHIGIKPLYVARTSSACVFASEVRAVLASGLVPADLDEAGIATFLAYGSPQDPLTVHRNIRSVQSGTCQWIGAEAAVGRESSPPRRYWRFPSTRQIHRSDRVALDIRQRVADAVVAQCTADVPIAVFLSSGIDSATIAAFAQDHQKGVRSFTVGNSVARDRDESREAAETARLIGTNHSERIIDDEWIISESRNWLQAADRPSSDGLNTYIVCHALKDSGSTVALSGVGADELFGGYHTFEHVRRLSRLLAPFKLLPPGVRGSLPKAALFMSRQKRARAAELLSTNISSVGLTLGMRRLFSDSELHHLGFSRRRLGLTSEWLPQEAYEPLVDPDGDFFRGVCETDLFFYMSNTLLRDADINSMAHSVEVRVPFLSRKVVEWVGSIPGAVHFPPGPARKHLLRLAVADVLPRCVLERKKRGFRLPFVKWINTVLKEESDCHVRRLCGWPGINGAAVWSMWSGCRDGEVAAHEPKQIALMSLGNYLSFHTNSAPQFTNK